MGQGSTKSNDKQETVAAEENERNLEPKEDCVKAESTQNKSDSVTDSVKPVLYDKSQHTIGTRLSLWLVRNTYLQPDDCIPCKIALTACASLFCATLCSAYRTIYIAQNSRPVRKAVRQEYKRKLLLAKRVAYGTTFAIWVVFLYTEWFNALFLPPGDKPRSFFDREAKRSETLREIAKQFQEEEKLKSDKTVSNNEQAR